VTTRARTWAERTGTRVRPWSARRRSPNPRALVPAFGQVRRAPLPSVVPARAYKSLPGRASLHSTLTITGQPPLLSSGELFFARHCRQSLGHRGQPTPATPKSSQCFG
jgi:hypothetical protein